jgi:predicted nucleotidyltransferase
LRAGDPNIDIIEAIAAALGPLGDQFAFVGGCAAGLMITDPARAAIRATTDVDVIVELGTRAAYYALAERLRAAGFAEDQELICRWTYRGIAVDILPTDGSILDLDSPWFKVALESASPVTLPSGTSIYLISAPMLLVTKLVAFSDRGRGDFQGSHDLEDIVAVIDGRPELLDEVHRMDVEAREFLAEEFEALLAAGGFAESIPYHLRPDAASQSRASAVLGKIRSIARI